MQPELIDAIIPAGGRIAGDFAREAGCEVKALISLGGQTILARTIAALRASERVRRIVVIGPPEVEAAAAEADQVLGEGASGPQNIFRGLEWLRLNGVQSSQDAASPAESAPGESAPLGRVLIVTSDLPFVTPEVVAGFVDSCSREASVCVPALRRHEFEARFPGLGGEYVRLRDGEWTAGCAFLLDGEVLLARRALIEAVFQARKSQWAMARLLGAPFIALWLARRLETRHIQKRCESVLRCRGQILLSSAPELAFDIDGLEELRYAAKYLP